MAGSSQRFRHSRVQKGCAPFSLGPARQRISVPLQQPSKSASWPRKSAPMGPAHQRISVPLQQPSHSAPWPRKSKPLGPARQRISMPLQQPSQSASWPRKSAPVTTISTYTEVQRSAGPHPSAYIYATSAAQSSPWPRKSAPLGPARQRISVPLQQPSQSASWPRKSAPVTTISTWAPPVSVYPCHFSSLPSQRRGPATGPRPSAYICATSAAFPVSVVAPQFSPCDYHLHVNRGPVHCWAPPVSVYMCHFSSLPSQRRGPASQPL
nr:uncharacterized protein LOC127315842 [Lolium perenne]